jgi:hypothetical protein
VGLVALEVAQANHRAAGLLLQQQGGASAPFDDRRQEAPLTAQGRILAVGLQEAAGRPGAAPAEPSSITAAGQQERDSRNQESRDPGGPGQGGFSRRSASCCPVDGGRGWKEA